ncbi:hypothetical protein [Leyella stercorea]|uniref:hypothetical protein n=1 Tax=Leyella stercorea TaxID=363265 RepID=UPI0024310BC7|nr:hypothetical protein [Leyella stercorea]
MIRADRRRCLRRPMRMSAPTDADVCTDRCGCLRRPMRMVKRLLLYQETLSLNANITYP